MSVKTKWVTFRTSIIIPGAVLGEEADRKIGVGEPVQLPEAYANHVVHERFGAFCDAPRKSRTRKPEATVKVTAEQEAEIDAARDAVDAAQAALDAAEGEEAKAEATAVLATAQATLDALSE
ncbi:hypothetical protein [Pararhodobacter sp. CCB-MM2]|uniref:hypothetical protein n=1 Tax=Pararhodobacter sp. CCB-MM2 TaxID=1786003 RepID=UPI000830E560|nr:hypothetical protein [Pararhodobacter sp. CCB-MM2]